MSTPASRLPTAAVAAAAAAATLLACCAAVAADTPATPAAPALAALEARIAALETRVVQAEHAAQAARDRGAVENLFSHYMYLHNTFQDERIKALWAKRGTPGVSAQYSNLGVYTNYDSIMAYHSGRPTPTGKLIFHYLTTPLIEIAADGRTAKGRWIAAGVESGLMTPEVAAKAPAFLFEKAEADGNEVHGKKVWAHWVQMQYGLDFIRQDGEWKILHFRCFEVSRARFDKNWIALAAEVQDSSANSAFNADLMYLGDDGKPVYMPKVDGPPKSLTYSYRPDAAMAPDVPIPVPYRTLSETFEY